MNYTIIDKNSQIFDVKNYRRAKLTPSEVKKLRDVGLVVGYLKQRYNETVQRTKKRHAEDKIAHKWRFIRALVDAVISTSEKEGVRPEDILKSHHIHSVNYDHYLQFQLLHPKSHSALHKKNGKRSRCQYCDHLKLPKDMTKTYRCKDGYYNTCTDCQSLIRKEQRELKKLERRDDV